MISVTATIIDVVFQIIIGLQTTFKTDLHHVLHGWYQVRPEYRGWFNRKRQELKGMNFGELRDKLLAVAPLDAAWIRRVNIAEAAFWRLNTGVRVDWSDKVLGFECGGEQWVSEVTARLNIWTAYII
jgi:hypothetical protein